MQVVFVRDSSTSLNYLTDEETNEINSTEFGFENYVDTTVVVRDPPSPIPLPVPAVPEDQLTNTAATSGVVGGRDSGTVAWNNIGE